MKKENIKLHAALYFLLSLAFNFTGLIVGLCWLKFKAKTKRKIKLIALLVGFGVYVFNALVITPYIIEPRSEKLIYSKFPEMKIIKESVEMAYPQGKVGVNYHWKKSLTNGDSETIKTLTVVYDDKHLLFPDQIQNIGKMTCSVLKSQNKSYNYVVVLSQTSLRSYIGLDIPFLNFYRDETFGGTCKEWMSNEVSSIK